MNRILLIDDEPNLLAALQRLIRSLQIECECVFAANGLDGLERARACAPDIIVTDIRMPKMSGLDLLSRLKSDPSTKQIPVIVLTGHGDSTAKQAALELGAHDFIDKPAVPAEFAARIRSLFKMKEYEDQLRERNEMLERQVFQLQKMENIGFLAAGFSHDLRNILAAIVGHIDMASSTPDLPETVRARLNSAAETAIHAAQLSSQMLSMSRPAGDGRVLCDMTALVTECLNLFAVSIRPDIQIRWSAPGAGMLFLGNSMQIHQVLMNLLINGVHAIPGAGMLVLRVARVSIKAQGASATPPGEYIRLEVADTGVGMDTATIQHIFEPFFTTRMEGKGTGLGLSVVQRIVHEHGGSIGVESELRRGTTFRIHFPAAALDAAPQGSIAKGETGDVVEAANPLR